MGFECHRLTFAESGTTPVDNLFARLGSAGPHLCFAGHTDVVPEGDVTRWTHPPFRGHIADGILFGRGAVDMKGSIASFVAAVSAFLEKGGIGAGVNAQKPVAIRLGGVGASADVYSTEESGSGSRSKPAPCHVSNRHPITLDSTWTLRILSAVSAPVISTT